MRKLKSIKLKDVKGFFRKLPKFLGERAFLVFLALLGLSMAFGGLIFYQYNTLIEQTESDPIEKQLKFKSKTYQRILEIWQEKENKFKETDLKVYPNLFVP